MKMLAKNPLLLSTFVAGYNYFLSQNTAIAGNHDSRIGRRF
jgi:hypothetical protein